MGKTLPQETINEIRELLSAGVTWDEVQKEYHTSRTTLNKYFGTPRKSTAEQTKKMLEMRHNGLSNSQIVHDLGVSIHTVRRHLGNQPSGNRAEYGSIVSKVTGEKFYQKGPATPVEKNILTHNKLQHVSTSECLKGKAFTYICDDRGVVTVTHAACSEHRFTEEDIANLIAELYEVGHWFEAHKKQSETRMDGTPKAV